MGARPVLLRAPACYGLEVEGEETAVMFELGSELAWIDRGDTLVLSGPKHFLELAGDEVSVFRVLLPLLDGRRSLAELSNLVGEKIDGVDEATVSACTSFLMEQGLVVDRSEGLGRLPPRTR